ncbi:ice-binding family protein [Clostridium sp.]
MKTLNKMRFISLLITPLLTIAILSVPTVSMASQKRVIANQRFAVLAGTTITNTGKTVIKGDVGLFPGTALTGQESLKLNGKAHLADNDANVAKLDLVHSYNDVDTISPATCIPTELGGKTLTHGNYNSGSGTFEITGTLTLDAKGDPNAYFIFRTASTLITATGSTVKLINGANPNNVIWEVGSSSTLQTDSHFQGRIFALTSITVNRGATVRGQLLARNGAVTLDNNIIEN